MKAYIVSKCGNCSDDGVDIGVYLNKEKCYLDVEELNKPRKEEEKLYDICNKCVNDDNGREDNEFRLKNICPRASIKADRNGIYCENDLSNWYSLKEDTYYIREADVLDSI